MQAINLERVSTKRSIIFVFMDDLKAYKNSRKEAETQKPLESFQKILLWNFV